MLSASRDSSEQPLNDTTPIATNVIVELEKIISTFAQHQQPQVRLLPPSSVSCLVASPSPTFIFKLGPLRIGSGSEIHSTRLFSVYILPCEELGYAIKTKNRGFRILASSFDYMTTYKALINQMTTSG